MTARKKPDAPVAGTNLTAAQSGDRRAALVALRDTLADLLDTTDKQIHAQLAAQYRATLADLAAIKAADGKSRREQLAERAAAANIVA